VVQWLCDSDAQCSGRKNRQQHGSKQAPAAHAGSDHPQARRGQQALGGRQGLNVVCRHLKVAESTWHRWVARYGGMKANTGYDSFGTFTGRR
jgi:hypothetical protein